MDAEHKENLLVAWPLSSTLKFPETAPGTVAADTVELLKIMIDKTRIKRVLRLDN
jgi:hypothetical protein